jgi:hypothetical protein
MGVNIPCKGYLRRGREKFITTLFKIKRGQWSKDAFFAEIGKKEVPLGRVETLEDIAGVALLASELSAYVTAEAIFVSDGLIQLPHGATISG